MIGNNTANKTGERHEAMGDFVLILAHGLVTATARQAAGGGDLAVARQQKTMSRATLSPTHGRGRCCRLYAGLRYMSHPGEEWRARSTRLKTTFSILFMLLPPSS
jgi:hypothetical protein